MHNNEKPRKSLCFLRAVNDFMPLIFWSCLIFGFEEAPIAAATIFAAAIHESGHIICLLSIRKGSVGRIRSFAFGLRIKAADTLSYDSELMLYAAGPAANLITALLCFILSPKSDSALFSFALLNLATAVSNLLPAEGYDGYGIIRTVIEKRNAEWALRLLSYVSSSIIFSFSILSLYLIDRMGGGYWIFAVFFAAMIKDFGKRLPK